MMANNANKYSIISLQCYTNVTKCHRQWCSLTIERVILPMPDTESGSIGIIVATNPYPVQYQMERQLELEQWSPQSKGSLSAREKFIYLKIQPTHQTSSCMCSASKYNSKQPIDRSFWLEHHRRHSKQYVPHESSVDSHQLLMIYHVSFIQYNTYLIIVASHKFNNAPELVGNIQFVCVEQ